MTILEALYLFRTTQENGNTQTKVGSEPAIQFFQVDHDQTALGCMASLSV